MGFSLADNRSVRMFAMVGAYIDSTSADDLSVTGPFLSFSNVRQLTDAIYTIDDIATFEGDGIPTARQTIAPPLTTDASLTNVQFGVWTSSISDASGSLSAGIDMTFNSHQHDSSITFYFGEVFPVDFTIGWYLGGTLVKTFTVRDNASQRFLPIEDDEPVHLAYDRIVLNILKVSQPYRHMTIAEIEFGASYTIGSDYISGTAKVIYSHDPLGLTQSPNELDLSYINIGGTFDDDNPNGLYDNFALKNTINLAMEVSVENTKVTYSMGRFYISDRYVTGNHFNVTALDCRGLMQNVLPIVQFQTNVSIGDTLEDLLTDNNIAHSIDQSLYSIYPQNAVAFDGRTDLLTITQYAVQFCEREMWVTRDGILTIGTRTIADYGNIEADDMYAYPSVESVTAYNVVQVTYGQQVYEIDESGADPRIVIAVDNPFVVDQTKAQNVAQRIASGFIGYCKRTKWRGDLELEQGNEVNMATRFTDTSDADDMVVTEVTFEFNGMLRSNVTAVTLRS